MPQLKLFVLGHPRVMLDDDHLEIKPRKALALLIYLFCNRGWQARDKLATVFWPESSQAQARAALRRRLSELNKSPVGAWLEADRESVRVKENVDLWLDVGEFEQAVEAYQTHEHPPDRPCPDCLNQLTTAATIYQDDFLSGFTLPDCPAFDDWQFFQTEEHHQTLSATLQHLIQLHQVQGDPAAAIPYARRWLALDPLHEPAHQDLMRLYAQAGLQAAALRQYERCMQTFADEFGFPPSEETTALYERIRMGEEKPSTVQTTPPTEAGLVKPPIESVTQTPSPKPEDEIRLVTILFADMSRSVELTWDLDPEKTADLVNRLLQSMLTILSDYEARIDRLLGDGLMAIFGAPQVREDDAERAIRAALDIQAAAQSLGLGVTVGINSGLVYFGQMGSDVHQEVTVMGPVVNLAARLQGQASAGQIIVGQATYQQNRRAFYFSPLSLNLKGIPHPINAYEVNRARRRAVKSRGLDGIWADMVGRAEELNKLEIALGHLLLRARIIGDKMSDWMEKRKTKETHVGLFFI